MRIKNWLLLLAGLSVALVLCAPQAFTFPAADGCRTCHPDYQGGPGAALHDMHVGTMQMTNNCQLCHTSFFDIPDINESVAGVSCVGCHLPNGLWEHHLGASISCAPCHTTWPTPDPENTLPPYYGRSDVAISDPCLVEPAAGGEDYSGDGFGLDNDGDFLYDAADPDCDPVPVEKSTWGGIKSVYSE
jgi:hypothetical protein